MLLDTATLILSENADEDNLSLQSALSENHVDLIQALATAITDENLKVF
ncbi:hypothetical protein [Nostoc sp. C110]